MVLKKFSLILVTMFLLNLGSASAMVELSEPQRFVEIRQNNTLIGHFDTETLRYEKDCYRDELLLNVWIKTIPESDSSEYTLYHYLFRISKRELMPLDQIQYNSSGKIMNKTSNIYNTELWTQILPETIAEKWYLSALKYAHDNDKKLRHEYKNRKKGYSENTDNDFFAPFKHIFSGLRD